jgi:hypothetical protein
MNAVASSPRGATAARTSAVGRGRAPALHHRCPHLRRPPRRSILSHSISGRSYQFLSHVSALGSLPAEVAEEGMVGEGVNSQASGSSVETAHHWLEVAVAVGVGVGIQHYPPRPICLPLLLLFVSPPPVLPLHCSPALPASPHPPLLLTPYWRSAACEAMQICSPGGRGSAASPHRATKTC